MESVSQFAPEICSQTSQAQTRSQAASFKPLHSQIPTSPQRDDEDPRAGPLIGVTADELESFLETYSQAERDMAGQEELDSDKPELDE